MSDFELNYRQMMQQALKGVVREVLEQVAEHGFPGNHHAFLTFRTDRDLVTVPSFLRERYPEEMTIVLQNQFWDLFVDDDGISVTLTFGGSQHRIGMPWEAVTAFVDPEAEFGLHFTDDEAEAEAETVQLADASDGGGKTADPADEPIDPSSSDTETPTPSDDGENVVSIDRFRKK